MAIKIKGKYTNPILENIQWKKGMYDTQEFIVKINANGSIASGKEVFLGYQGEDHMRIINFDTRDLKWNKLADDGEGNRELYDFYTPTIAFYNKNKKAAKYYRNSDSGLILMKNGKLQITEDNGTTWKDGLPNPLVITADENWCFVPNEITEDVADYEIVYILIEKQTDSDEDTGNIGDCSIYENKEVFVSEVFKGNVLKSSKELFEAHEGGDYNICHAGTPGLGDQDAASLQKPTIKLINTNGVFSLEDKATNVELGYQGDVFITPIQILLPIAEGVWDEKKNETNFEIIFAQGESSYRVKPHIIEAGEDQRHLKLTCWIPKEVTEKETKYSKWSIALHFNTIKEPIFESYTTVVNGNVKYTFLTLPVAEQDETVPLYEAEGNALIINGEDWNDGENDLDIWGSGDYDEENKAADLGIHQI